MSFRIASGKLTRAPGGEAIAIEADGRIAVRLGASKSPDAVVKGKPESVLRLFTGRTSLAAALAEGVQWEGPRAALSRVVGNAV
jgi:hypothetical protein